MPRRTTRTAWSATLATVLTAGLAVLGAGPAHAATAAAVPTSTWAPWKACASSSTDNCASVRALARAAGGTVFLAGDFTELRSPAGERVPAGNIAALGPDGAPLAGFAAHVLDGTAYALATDGTSVYVGGASSRVDGAAGMRVARFDAATGARRPFRSAVSGTVHALALSGGQLFLAGRFTAVQGAPRASLAALDPATGAVRAAFAPRADMPTGGAYPDDDAHNTVPVRALAVSPDGRRLYVAGDLDDVDGAPRTGGLAALDPATGVVDRSFATKRTDLDASVQGMSLAVPAGGGVVLGTGGLRNAAYRFDDSGAQSWSVLTDGDVQAAAVSGGTVYLGGHFTYVCRVSCYDGDRSDDVARTHVVAVPDAASDRPDPDPTWAPSLAPIVKPHFYGVWALLADGGAVHAGGVFTSVRVGTRRYAQPAYAAFPALP